jgi:hypothetical protein
MSDRYLDENSKKRRHPICIKQLPLLPLIRPKVGKSGYASMAFGPVFRKSGG